MSSTEPQSSGPPLRALAMVLISLAILFAAIGVISVAGSSDSTPVAIAAASVVPSTPAAAAPPTTTAAPTTSVDQASIPVIVYNNSQTQGLAATTAATLQAKGWTIADTTNYSDEVIPQTTVYYGTGAGEQAAATTIASELGVSAVPRIAGLADKPAGVIVIVTQ